MAKYTVDENREIRITSYYKSISKNRIDNLVSSSLYKLQFAALKLNGFEGDMSMIRNQIHSELGASFDYNNNSFMLLGKKLLEFEYELNGSGFGFKTHIYNIETGEEFPQKEIDKIVAGYKQESHSYSTNFEESLQKFRNLSKKSKEDSEEEKPKNKKQESTLEEPKGTIAKEEPKPKIYTEEEIFNHMDESFRNGEIHSRMMNFNEIENEQERMYRMMYDCTASTGESDVCELTRFFYNWKEVLDIKQTSLKQLTAACNKFIDCHFVAIPYFSFIEDDIITGENGRFPRWEQYVQRAQVQ